MYLKNHPARNNSLVFILFRFTIGYAFRNLTFYFISLLLMPWFVNLSYNYSSFYQLVRGLPVPHAQTG